MTTSTPKTIYSWFISLSFGLLFSATISAEQSAGLQYIRTVDSDDLLSEAFFRSGHPNYSGVSFPPGANTLLELDQASGGANFIVANPPKDKQGKVTQSAISMADPINIAFDSVSVGAKGFGVFRIFLWDPNSSKLIAIKAGARNVMDAAKSKRFDVPAFRVANAQGMTINPATGQLFLLDGDAATIIAIQPKLGRDFTGAGVSQIMLPGGLGKLRGMAFNPENNHLYAFSAGGQMLHELTLTGELVTSMNIEGNPLGNPQAMAFAPSLDLTDHPSIYHLFVITGQGANGKITEWALPGSF